jgi:L-glutamine-phosphate cytidylyltransferase
VQVVLLAAGLGSRLGSLTASLPKALIRVAGVPLLAHALRFAAALRPTEVIVVGGFGFDQLTAEIDRRGTIDALSPPAAVTLIQNPHYTDGNLLSLLAARHRVADDLVLLNVDHIYPTTMAAPVTTPVAEVTAFVDTDRPLGPDDMKVRRDRVGRLCAIDKTLAASDAGYIGITRVPRPALARYFAEADAALAAEGRAIAVEGVLARLAVTDAPPLCRDVSGHRWWEVDTPEERDRAEAALRDPGWRH